MKRFGETFLYTPGPVAVPHRILQAYTKPLLHHRTAEFSAMLRELLEKWQWLFATKQPVLPIHTTGRGAMEATISNLLQQGDSIISVCNGKFAEFYATIAEKYGLTVHRVANDWEKPVSLAELEATIKAHPEAKAITFCHNESTTGVTLPIEPIVALAHAHGMLTLVDAVSSGGCIRIDFDACGADSLVVASQKGLMCSAGTSLAILSDRAWEACETSNLPKYFTNFKAIRKSTTISSPETPGSTPVTSIYGLLESIRIMQEEGREALFLRHARMGKAVRATLVALGFKLFPMNIPEDQRSNSLTAFTLMDGLSAEECKTALKKDFGIQIAGGLGHLKSSVLRIGHMGHFYDRDALCLAACLEGVLATKGLLKTSGAGLSACLNVLKKD